MKKLAVTVLAASAVVAGCAQSAPKNCDPASDYVCKPETTTETTKVDVPTSKETTTETVVPTTTQSEIVTTTVKP